MFKKNVKIVIVKLTTAREDILKNADIGEILTDVNSETTCLYKHETSRPRQPFENEFEIVKQELERLLKLLAEKDEKICVIMKNFENVEKAENEAKIKYDNVIRDLDEKAVKIEELESKLEKFTETAKKPEENLQRTLHETFAPYLEHFDIIENRANYRLDTLEKQLLSLTATSNHKKRGRNSDAT